MILKISRSTLAVSTVLFALSITAGCASKGDSKDSASGGAAVEAAEESKESKKPPETNEPTGPSLLAAGKTVSNYVVIMNTENMADDVAEVAEAYKLGERLDGFLRKKNAAADGGDLEVHVTVNNMRLRNNALALVAGLAAGPDWIAVDVDVKENGQSVKSFQTKSVTTRGGGRTSRIKRMAKDLGNKIAAGL